MIKWYIFPGDVMRALGQNPTESEVKKLVNEHRADDRVTFEVFLPIMQVSFEAEAHDCMILQFQILNLILFSNARKSSSYTILK